MNVRFPETETYSSPSPTISDRIGQTSPRTRLIAGIAAIVLAFVAWKWWSAAPTERQRPPPPVVVGIVTQKDVPVVEHTIGTVVSNATVQVTARVEGQLLRAFFNEGQMVHRGDLLFQIDPRPYQAAYNSAAASLTAARAKAARYQALLAQKAVSPQEADDARAAYLQAKAATDTARLNLGYTQIRSPINGKTGPILIQPGNVITASAGTASAPSVTTGTPTNVLVVISQLQPIKISFSLPQADLPRIQARQAQGALTVTVDNHGANARPLSATVDFVSNAVDDKTGTIELRATFGNESGVLVPGQLVDIAAVLDMLKHTAVVPHDSVNVGPNGRYVYAVRRGKAEMVPVDVLEDDGTTIAVKGPLTPGERVITDGQLRVIPGAAVIVAKSRSRTK